MALTAPLHDAMSAYARQQRAGQALLLGMVSKPEKPPPDPVSLRTTSHNMLKIRQVAASVVLRRHGNLSPTEQSALIAALEQKARLEYADLLEGDVVPVDALQEWLLSHDEYDGGVRVKD